MMNHLCHWPLNKDVQSVLQQLPTTSPTHHQESKPLAAQEQPSPNVSTTNAEFSVHSE